MSGDAGLTLYHNDLSTCAQKVRIALAEKALDWESVELDLRAGEQKTPEFLALNPAGVVPVLVHGETTVTESTIILEYLEDGFPGRPLRPESAAARALMRGWMKRLDDRLHAMTGVLSFALAFRHEYLALPDKGQKLIDGTPDPMARAAKMGLIQQGADFPAVGTALQEFDAALGELDAVLAESSRGFIAGSYSLAEAAWIPYVNRLEHLGLGWLWDDRQRVAKWWDDVRARDSYSVAIANVEKPDRVRLMHEKSAEVSDRMASWREELAQAG
ncbi:glutathione S-transferase family protein [Erythrobacter rubeus]|uniref:Glutathione S-transferase family protein n=1 Tax=Erythrobacter rubeus TaxID=2760803 RepID=A0ABR8KRN2_9SPHN|nr:glutathione S-transferase family protein [Erythrobacter rubeus]MBD2841888.1 glutathione S-transferase family protein [Erythrobacter rubeus]